jgi:hypothetical protein
MDSFSFFKVSFEYANKAFNKGECTKIGMGYTVIAPVGDNLKALFVGIKEFPTEKVILITPSENIEQAQDLSSKLDEFTIESEIIEIDQNIMEDMFKVFGSICSKYNQDDIVVNVATGDRMTTCAALTASFVNGLKAFGVMNNKAMMLPIMKLSYYNELSESKLKILDALDIENFTSLKDLGIKTGMSISLLSYHVNGNFKYKGLKEYRLAETKEKGKNLYVRLSELGNLLLKGYITQGTK